MKKLILRGAVLALTGAVVLLAGGCQPDGVTTPPKTDLSGNMPPPPLPPTGRHPDHGRLDTGKVYSFAEQMPSFPGGEPALMKYLHDRIRYPAEARENGIQGTIVVQFVVNKDGSLSDFSTLGPGKGGGLAEEAMRVVKGMPGWKPGMQDGKVLAIRYALPVRFVLQ